MKVKRQLIIHSMPIASKRTTTLGFLAKTQNTILSAAFILAASSGLNAILGLVKNRMLAQRFGVSQDLAIFYTADRIPNLVYSVLVVGALSTIFIPLFTESVKKSKEKAYEMASTLINSILLFFIVLCAIAWISSPQIMTALGLGTFNKEQIVLGTTMMRIMLLAQFLLVCGSLSGSVLQSYKMFIIPALAPVVYNFGIIIGIAYLTPHYGILGPVYGTLIGALLHFLLQLIYVKSTGFKWEPLLHTKSPLFNQMLKLTPPRIVSVLIANSLTTINNSLAILISPASVVYLKFGTQLYGFPVTLFGASIAAASLPTLSAETTESDLTKFKKTFLTSFHQMMFLVMPASMLLLVLLQSQRSLIDIYHPLKVIHIYVNRDPH